MRLAHNWGSNPQSTSEKHLGQRILLLIVVILTPAYAHAQNTSNNSTTTEPLRAFLQRCKDNQAMKCDEDTDCGTDGPCKSFVTVKKKLTVNRVTGTVVQECTFKNSGTQKEDFLFCNMVALNKATGKTTTSINTCNIEWDMANNEWKCVVGANTMTPRKPSFHFGCTVVSLAGGASQPAGPTTGANPEFKKQESKDFDVSYADIFDMSGGATFDAQSCADLACFGVDADTNIELTVVRDNGFGDWVLRDEPITDPFVVWQNAKGIRTEPEYQAVDAPLSLPSDFPVACVELERTSPGVDPPLQYDVDLNMWDIFTMSASEGVITPVNIIPVVPENPYVAVHVVPSQHDVVGGSQDIGDVLIERLLSPEQIPQDTLVDFSILFEDSDTGEELWRQYGLLSGDTEPPEVLSHSASFTPEGDILLNLNTTDATTGAIQANVWFIRTSSSSCQAVPLVGSATPFAGPGDNEFSGSIPSSMAAIGGKFFYNVQDGVNNNLWFGPASVWAFFGVAQGGTVDFEVEHIPIQVITVDGDTASQVADKVANAVNSNSDLAACGITASASGNRTVVLGDVGATEINDAGLQHTPTPTLPEWGLIVLTVLLLAAGTVLFGRRRRPAAA